MLENNELSISDISRVTKVSNYTITEIKQGKKWKHISCEFDVSNHTVKAINTGSVPKYNNSQIQKVCELLETKKYTINEIVNMTSVGLNTVANIKRHKTWVKISKKYNF